MFVPTIVSTTDLHFFYIQLLFCVRAIACVCELEVILCCLRVTLRLTLMMSSGPTLRLICSLSCIPPFNVLVHIVPAQ